MDSESKTMTPRKEWFSLQSPIGNIGGFAAIVEVAIILASIFVEGPARWALIVFAAAAFFYVSSWFFWILTHQAWVLYPPKEFSGETGISTYAEAYRERSVEKVTPGADGTELIEQLYATSVTVAHPIQPHFDSQIEEDIGEDNGFLVFAGPRRPDSLGLFVDYDAFHSVSDCLVYIANTLLPEFESDDQTEKQRRHEMNYGTTWRLRESKTKRVLTDIGARWAYKQSGNISDLRRPAETDLRRGVHLELERLREESFTIAELLHDDEKLLRDEVV